MLNRDEKTFKSFGAAGKVVLVEKISAIWWNRYVPRKESLMKMMVAFTEINAWSLWTDTFFDQLATWWIDLL